MEQIQAIMEAAKRPIRRSSSRRAAARARYSQDNYLQHLMLAAAELYPEIPIAMHQDHGNSPATCKSAIDEGLHQRDDGRLAEGRRQDPADFEYNVQSRAKSSSWPTRAASRSKASSAALGGIEDGHGADADAHVAPHRSRPGG